MTTSTLTVTEFVLARIAEDEARATRASSAVASWPMVANEAARLSADAGWHVLDHNPARVLAQCAAMRKIVEMFQTARPAMGEWESDYASAAYDAVRALASIWSDHPQFDPAWA
jgi:hypothetical protein